MGGDAYPSLCAGDNWEQWISTPGYYWMDYMSKHSYWREPQCMFVAAGVGCMHEEGCTRNWSRAVVLGTCMPMCQQLRRLGSQSSYCMDEVSELSYWRDLLCTYIYIFPLRCLCLGQPERGTEWGCWCCSNLCQCWMSVCVDLCGHIYI